MRFGWLAAAAALVTAAQADAAAKLVTATRGAEFRLPYFTFNISFSTLPLAGVGGKFTGIIAGTISPDPRYCSDPPAPFQVDACQPAGFGDMRMFDAGGGPEQQNWILPFFAPAYDGLLSFGPTDGASILIDVPFGIAVPEPASWGMMISGVGLLGSLLRRRRAGKYARAVA